MQAKLQENLGFGLDKIYFCPHAPNQNCACRKPKVGMLEQALQDYPLDLAQSVLVGDKMSDIEFGLKGDWHQFTFSLQEPQAQGRIARLEQVLDFLTPQKGHFCISPTP